MARLIASEPLLDDLVDQYEDSIDEEERRKAKADDKRQKMSALVTLLKGEADSRVGGRTAVEQQWVEDLLQYHQRFSQTEIEEFGKPENQDLSQLYMSKTRDKTNGMIARLENILFPVDENSWTIDPTPVPELSEKTKAAGAKLDDLKSQQQDPSQPDPDPAQVSALQQAVDAAQAIMAEAEARAKLMEAEIADQLAECRFPAHCRDVLEDGCKVGTGIMLGPLHGEKAKRQWAQVPLLDEDGEPVVDENTGEPTMTYELQITEDKRPAAWRVPYWDVYPSKDARGCEDSEGFYLRNVWTPKQLRSFARLPGVDQDAVRHVLEQSPSDTAPNYLTQLRAIGDANGGSLGSNRFYTVWQYIGPLTVEHMRVLAEGAGDHETANELADADPLLEQQAIVWFCNDSVMKFSIYPLDSDRPLVHAWRFEKEEGSFWGYGLPRIIRNPDAAIGAAWRTLMNNADLSSGGLLFIDTTKLQAQDGDTKRLYGRKVFIPTAGKAAAEAADAVRHIDIPSRQDQLVNIIELARRQVDEESNQPSMGGDGEKVPVVTNTAAGTAMWLNSFNVMLFRVIKNWDDDLTTPVISAFYDWNMQFSEKDEIKGDYQCVAKGSSVLLVREIQAQNILTLTLSLAGHPRLGAWVKEGPSVREVYRANRLKPAEFVRTDAEAQEEQARQAQMAAAAAGTGATGPDPQVEQAKVEQQQADTDAKVAISQDTNATRRYVADRTYDAKMSEVAEALNMKQDDLETKLAMHRETIAAGERSTAAEIAVRASEKTPLNQTQVGQPN